MNSFPLSANLHLIFYVRLFYESSQRPGSESQALPRIVIAADKR